MAEAPPTRGVLITRPEPGASETAARLTARGYRPILAPMLTIAPRALHLPSTPPQAVLVTSGNAIPALPATLHDIPLLAVGDATAARARAAGFANVRSAGRDAEALAVLTRASCAPSAGPLLLASGAQQGLDLAANLREHGFRVLRRVAYAALPSSTLPDTALSALIDGDVTFALFFSPATARIFVRLLRQRVTDSSVSNVEALVISRATRAALFPLPWRRIRVASYPKQEELLALMP